MEAAGTTSTIERWVEAHGDALFAYALLRVRHRETAEDLVQETFIAAMNQADRFEGRSKARTWLIGILRHKVLDHFRRNRRRGEIKEQLLGDGEGTLGLYNKRGKWEPKLTDWSGDPAALYENQEFWRVYEGCRVKLPSLLFEAYLLREIEGLGVEEVCQILGITATNLSVRLHRARLMLRQCLAKHWFES